MKIYDISLPLREGMPLYPGDPPFERRVVASMETGASSEVSRLAMGSHTGTHLDAPAHMIPGGRRLDDIPLEALVGPARVVDLRAVEGHIEEEHLRDLPWEGVRRVLFRTRNSGRWKGSQGFDKGFAALTGSAAEFLAEKNLLLVGVDGLSVDRFRSGTHPAHLPLLRAGVALLEGLDLGGVPAGDYTLFCGPLRIAGAEGAPARAMLVVWAQ